MKELNTEGSNQAAPQQPGGRHRQAFWVGMLFTLSSAILWGSTYPVIGVALNSYNAFDIALYRAILASGTLVIYFLVSDRVRDMRPRREDMSLLFLGSVFGASGFWTLLNISVLFLEADTSSFLVALYPLIAIVLANIVLHERMTSFRAIGVIAGIAGTFIIVVFGEGAGFVGSQPVLGSIIAISAAFFWGGYMMTTKILIERGKASGRGTSPEYITFYNFLLAIPVTLVLVLLSGSGQSFLSFSSEGLSLVLYLGVIASGIAFLIFNKGIRLIGVSGAAINQLIFPAVAVILSYLFLGEVINLAEALGMGLIVAGIIVAQLLSRN
ncbi:MAG TPA: EamA family transporter [Nitrososphaerales archaeon]|nr:EamA family transporter [Nitrososphaerales archaeon]